MHILHIIGTLDPRAGGPQTAMRMLIDFQPEGYTSEVVTTDLPDAPFLAEYPVPAHGAGSGGWYAPKLVPWLKANRSRFDGVIVHGLWEYTGIAARKAFSGHVPYVVFPHGMLDSYFKRTFPMKHLKKWLFWLLAEYWNLRKASRVLFTTELEEKLAAESFPLLYRWRAEIAPLGSIAAPPRSEAQLDAFYARCPEVRGQRFMLYLGRIHPKKGADLLLKAFTLRQSDIHLVMAGPGADDEWAQGLRSALPADVAARVHWPGMLQGDAKWGAFHASDAFVLPSHQENFGIAVVEALAAARPVLITEPVNISPEIEADGAGLVGKDTVEGVSSLLKRWLTLNESDRAAMGEQALRTFAKRYDMRRNTGPILQVFERIRADRRR
ncbi:glycosyltransferase [Granulicella cerasi]|uniref:Glycosyltransferase n=1 Tax=Granulicella cerasi TaxID=741063 RepID=A0ABW1Z8K2_9BACT|nr:glycosyltransferase [Granulicella cerasi]